MYRCLSRLHSQPEQTSASGEIFKFAFSKSDYGRAARANMAQLYLTYCSTMVERIPTNTPAEEEWVARESRTNDIKKIGRLVQTNEFARSRLHSTFSDCLSNVTALVQAQQQKDLNRETSALLRLSMTFDVPDWSVYVRSLGLGDTDEFKFLSLNIIRNVPLHAALKIVDGR